MYCLCIAALTTGVSTYLVRSAIVCEKKCARCCGDCVLDSPLGGALRPGATRHVRYSGANRAEYAQKRLQSFFATLKTHTAMHEYVVICRNFLTTYLNLLRIHAKSAIQTGRAFAEKNLKKITWPSHWPSQECELDKCAVTMHISYRLMSPTANLLADSAM